MQTCQAVLRERLFSYIMAALIILLTGIVSAHAATITVTANAADVLNGADGQCSLREAITNINNGATTYADCVPTGAYATSDTINLPAGTYANAIAGASEDANATGDLDITADLTINGAGAATTVIDGGGIDRVLDIPFFTVTVTVIVSDVTIKGGSATRGGGIEVQGISTMLTLNRSTISGNTATGAGINSSGGGIETISPGGITILNNSTVSGNTANPGAGGGITGYHGTLTLNNSTVSGNGAQYYGGIATSNNGVQLNLSNSTIKGNSGIGGGGLGLGFNGEANIKNTIIAGNFGTDCGPPSNTVVNSLGHNLDGDNTCQLNHPSDLPGESSPLLGPLQDNGGPTQTHALLPGSPAIDWVPGADCTDTAGSPIATDQRGVLRPQDGDGDSSFLCDVGAFEKCSPAIDCVSDCDLDGVPDSNEGTIVKNFCVLCSSTPCSNGTQWSLEVQWGAGVYSQSYCPEEPNTTTSTAVHMANRLVSCINDTTNCPTIQAVVTYSSPSVTCFDLIGPAVPAAAANVCVGDPGGPATCCVPLFTPQNPIGCQFNPGLYELSLDGTDCNGNQRDDAIDILESSSADANGNGIPDECEPAVPTVSEWGLLVMTLIGLTAGTMMHRRLPLGVIRTVKLH